MKKNETEINMEEYTNELAQIIREVDGNHELGAGALAERIIATGFLDRVVESKLAEAKQDRYSFADFWGNFFN